MIIILCADPRELLGCVRILGPLCGWYSKNCFINFSRVENRGYLVPCRTPGPSTSAEHAGTLRERQCEDPGPFLEFLEIVHFIIGIFSCVSCK